MVYVMSDIHGCYDEFMKMLDLIQLKEDDTLYILGDVIDRGNGSLQILDYIMSHKNIKMLLGNHEDLFLKWYEHNKFLKFCYFLNWMSALPRCIFYKQFKMLKKSKQKEYVEFLKNLPLYEILKFNNEEYFLVHAGINCTKKINEQEPKDFLWAKGFVDAKNSSKYIIIFGHTMTKNISNDFIKNTENKILKYDKRIAIDCACVNNGKLGCLRLDDMKEFYVDKILN